MILFGFMFKAHCRLDIYHIRAGLFKIQSNHTRDMSAMFIIRCFLDSYFTDTITLQFIYFVAGSRVLLDNMDDVLVQFRKEGFRKQTRGLSRQQRVKRYFTTTCIHSKSITHSITPHLERV